VHARVTTVARMTALLLAEPEATMRGFLERQLRSEGFDVLAYPSAGEVPRAAEPDLLVLGDPDELDRCRVPDCPVIVLGRADPETKVRALARLRRLPDAAVRLRGARRPHSRTAPPLSAAQRAARPQRARRRPARAQGARSRPRGGGLAEGVRPAREARVRPPTGSSRASTCCATCGGIRACRPRAPWSRTRRGCA